VRDEVAPYPLPEERQTVRVKLFQSLLLIIVVALLVAGANPKSAARGSFHSTLTARTLRVMTYNIHVGVGMDKKLDLPRIAAVIKDQHADLVGLQEVDRGVRL